ncbi:hypothetical protein WJX79_006124 [Trebouxia sp. C0005]
MNGVRGATVSTPLCGCYAARSRRSAVRRVAQPYQHHCHWRLSCQAAEVQEIVTKQSRKSKASKSPQQPPSDSFDAQQSPPAIQTPQKNDIVLYYCTGWPEAKLHCSISAGEWQDQDFTQVNSSNGKWCVTRIPLNGALSHPSGDHPLLEFVVHDGQGKWDKPQTGDNYVISEAGVFSLSQGKLQQSSGEAVLLVYNWHQGNWVEDEQYARRLAHAWKLDTVREATYAALAAAGREKMHFRPPEEQNDHKVTCGVHMDVMDQVQQQISETLQKEGVEARLILSGKGDWRYLDIVSINAGKLQALEFVRLKYGFAHNKTIACGDSGNDKDMLSGQNLAIVVGNAQPDLMKWVNETQLDPNAKNARLLITDAHMAKGILEGLASFGLK